MPYCPNCGANNPDTSSFCSSCGAILNMAGAQVRSGYVSPIETGGLLAWSIVTLLLCTIPGIVAIVKTASINKSFTVEEQQQKYSSAKTWCIVGTILGVLAIIGMLAMN